MSGEKEDRERARFIAWERAFWQRMAQQSLFAVANGDSASAWKLNSMPENTAKYPASGETSDSKGTEHTAPAEGFGVFVDGVVARRTDHPAV